MRPGVYVTESVLATPVAPSSPAVAAGAIVAPLPSGPTTPTLVTSWYQYTRVFGGLNKDYDATFAVNQFFRAGGRELVVTRVVKSDAVKAHVTLKASDTTTDWLTFTAKSAGTYGNDLRVTIVKNARDLYDITVLQEAGVADSVATNTNDDTVLETYYDLDIATFGDQNVVNVFAVRSQFIDVAWESAGSAKTVAATFDYLTLASGADGVGTDDYTSALTALTTVDRTLILFSPGLETDATIEAFVTFAQDNGHFVVLDVPSDSTAAADAVDYAAAANGGVATSHAAVYTPWLWIADSTSRSRDAIRKVPPSGAVVGMYLNTDATYGVFKAPAGTQTVLPGVIALEQTYTAANLDDLNNDTSPVNAIRVVPGTGPVIMGARTLDQSASTRYINIRRSLLYLERELKDSLEFALYRNNDAYLWGQIRTVVDAFLSSFWTAGGLRGTIRSQAYYVKIDGENNTAADIANGVVNIEVGVALQYPAEFIKVKLTQQTLS